jgi:hypothetical protein
VILREGPADTFISLLIVSTVDRLHKTSSKCFIRFPPLRIRGGWRGYGKVFSSFNITPPAPLSLRGGFFEEASIRSSSNFMFD